MEPRKSFSNQLFSYLSTLEVVFLMASLVGVILLILHVEASRQLLLVSLAGLASIYFLTAFKPIEAPENNFAALAVVMLNKIISIGTAVGVIGLLFFILRFVGYQQLLLIGSCTIVIASLVTMGISLRQKEVWNSLKGLLLRAIPIAVAGIWILIRFGTQA